MIDAKPGSSGGFASASARILGEQEISAIGRIGEGDARDVLRIRRRLMSDRGGVVRELASALGADPTAGLVGLTARLGLTGDLEPVLLRLAEKAEPRVEAAVVTAIRHNRGEGVTAAIRERLTHEDQRVRANAVEALPWRPDIGAGDLRRILMEFKDDPNHRVRSSSVRAMFTADRAELAAHDARRVYEPMAVETAARMIEDKREMHRVAGAWLVRALAQSGVGPALGPTWERVCRAGAA